MTEVRAIFARWLRKKMGIVSPSDVWHEISHTMGKEYEEYLRSVGLEVQRKEDEE